MGDLLAWLLFFFVLIIIIVIVVYQRLVFMICNLRIPNLGCHITKIPSTWQTNKAPRRACCMFATWRALRASCAKAAKTICLA
ncbi:hypothetical protein CsSME_00050269 [Camellia sinensis var. sinensis]